MPITLKLNLSKIPENRIFKGKSGDLLDLVLFENRDGPDKYGQDGFIAISVSKEERETGTRGEIVGNWKHAGQRSDQPPPVDRGGSPARRPAPPPQRPPARPPADPYLDQPDDDIPF